MPHGMFVFDDHQPDPHELLSAIVLDEKVL